MVSRSVLLAAGVGVLATGVLVAGGYLPFREDSRPTPAVAPAPAAPAIEPAAAPTSPMVSAPPTTIDSSTTPTSPSLNPTARAKPSRTEAASPLSAAASSSDQVAATQPPVISAAPPPTEPPPPPAGASISDPLAAAAPPKPRFEELTITADSVLGIRIDQALSSETARVEDRVSARISRDVTVDGRIAIPTGARLEGVVVSVERGGKVRTRARLGLQFSTLILADGLRVPIATDVIFREGASPSPEAASKIGVSAAVGAALGAVFGGKKGAAIGTGAGAAGGTAAVMAGGRNDAAIAAGTSLTLRLTAPVTIAIPRDPDTR